MHKLFISIGMVLVLVFTGAAPASAQPTGWTPVVSDYATSVDTPTFSVCEVSQALKTITVKYRAQRPNKVAVSIAAVWNTKPDFSGVQGSASSSQWTAKNIATVRATKMPKTGVVVLSWQSDESGFGYTAPTAPATNILRCR